MCSIPRAGTEASFTSTAPKWWSLSIAEKLIAGRLVAENINGRESIVIFFFKLQLCAECFTPADFNSA